MSRKIEIDEQEYIELKIENEKLKLKEMFLKIETPFVTMDWDFDDDNDAMCKIINFVAKEKIEYLKMSVKEFKRLKKEHMYR